MMINCIKTGMNHIGCDYHRLMIFHSYHNSHVKYKGIWWKSNGVSWYQKVHRINEI